MNRLLSLLAFALCASLAATAGAASSPSVPPGFAIVRIAGIPRARELAATPNGDLFVGTESADVYIVPDADGAGQAATPHVFWSNPDDDAPNAGVAFVPSEHALYVGSNTAVWKLGYRAGYLRATSAVRIARVRTGPIAPHSDGDVHTTTSVAFTDGRLYVSVGSSCNACTEVDPTRASVLEFAPNGGSYTKKARRIRNAIALTVDPATGHLWIAGAGQDDLPFGHPYEFADDLSAHPGTADYGWPECEEDHVAYVRGANCASTVEPLVAIPAYSTIIGATFYSSNPRARYDFPARYGGGLFLAVHGSWHRSGGSYAAAPEVLFVPMKGDEPATRVDWHDPKVQWQPFLTGFQQAGMERTGRPTGITVGPNGSLFVADDQTGSVYRIRPIR